MIYHGHCLDVLKTLPDESVQMCVTSPPYFGLRDYKVPPAVWGGDPSHAHVFADETVTGEVRTGLGLAEYSAEHYRGGGVKAGAIPTFEVVRGACACGAWRGQLGHEPSPDLYIAHLVEVFREVRRVLKRDGTLWLNLGDSFARNPGKGVKFEAKSDATYMDNRQATEENEGPEIPEGLKEKDLIGIPWRVALALQAPHYDHVIRREADRAWLAALVDGEGCMSILETTSPHCSGKSYPPVLQIRMCDIECIARAVKLTGYGNGQTPRQYPPSQGGVRGSYQWRLSADRAARIAADIYPHLCIKRKQAIIVWNHQKIRESYETKKGVPIPRDAVEQQQACRALIQRLNQKQSVDIPSWMEEPKVSVTPGWYLRSDVIWHKPNCMPSSVKDRPTTSHEYMFLLSKSPRYVYDADAIAEPIAASTLKQIQEGYNGKSQKDYAGAGVQDPSSIKSRIIEKGRRRRLQTDLSVDEAENPRDNWAANDSDAPMTLTRNKRSVWTITTQATDEDHYAAFPEALVEPCVLAGSRRAGKRCDCDEIIETPLGEDGLEDPTLETGRAGLNRPRLPGQGTRPITRRQQRADAQALRSWAKPEEPLGGREVIDIAALAVGMGYGGEAFGHYLRTDRAGARPLPPDLRAELIRRGLLVDVDGPCLCLTEPADIVLDPFCGTGRSGEVALKLQRRYIGIDLHPSNVEASTRALQNLDFTKPLAVRPSKDPGPLFEELA